MKSRPSQTNWCPVAAASSTPNAPSDRFAFPLPAFDALAGSKEVREWLEAFRRATGLALKLVPPVPLIETRWIETPENPFCLAVRKSQAARPNYQNFYRGVFKRATRQVARQRLQCFAKFTHLAIPIVADGDHAATLYAGQILEQAPTREAFNQVAKRLKRVGLGKDLPRLERLWLASPVVAPRRLQACTQLLELFAQLLAEFAGRRTVAGRGKDPSCIALVKEFVRLHAAEPIRLRDAARHVHLSPQYLCKLFKKTMGITFIEYVNQGRIENAKLLLLDRSIPVKQAAYDSGFNSISHFEHIFHRQTGLSPLQWRAQEQEIGQQTAKRP